MEEDTNIDR